MGVSFILEEVHPKSKIFDWAPLATFTSLSSALEAYYRVIQNDSGYNYRVVEVDKKIIICSVDL